MNNVHKRPTSMSSNSDNLPAGSANNPDAPWNQQDERCNTCGGCTETETRNEVETYAWSKKFRDYVDVTRFKCDECLRADGELEEDGGML